MFGVCFYRILLKLFLLFEFSVFYILKKKRIKRVFVLFYFLKQKTAFKYGKQAGLCYHVNKVLLHENMPTVDVP